MARTVVHVTRSLTSPTATVGTAFQFSVVTVGVSSAVIGAASGGACRQCLWWTCSWSDDVDLVEELTALTTSGHLGRLLSVAHQHRVVDIASIDSLS